MTPGFLLEPFSDTALLSSVEGRTSNDLRALLHALNQ